MAMMNRQACIQSAHVVVRLMGGEWGHGPGQFGLDFAACYGGYKLVEYSEGGGVYDVLGATRRPAGEFVSAMNTAAAALRHADLLRRQAGGDEAVCGPW